jgi:6-phosphofructokinase 1
MDIFQLGERKFPSPFHRAIPDAKKIPARIAEPDCEIWFEQAGPREALYFNASKTTAGIVTCGGLCPGLNNVIRSIYYQLLHGYGVRQVLGFQYGFAGLDPLNELPPIHLTDAMVSDIHEQGGTILGSSRGPVEPAVMVNRLAQLGVDILFCIGGDGTLQGAHAIHEEAVRRGYPLSVVLVPKTIDNDIQWVWRTFGYLTAIEEARRVIDSAHTEARGYLNGIGLVKLMGRESGFIAAGAALASQEVNYVLIPEVPFVIEKFLESLEARLQVKRHAVIVVAEGAGQEYCAPKETQRDASGNRKFGDIGVFLRDRIVEHFKARNLPLAMKYFDPSYIIRSRPANCDDALLCDQLARHAVHAAMAGKSDVMIGNWYNLLTHVPLSEVAGDKKHVHEEGDLWQSVLASTGQPARFE